MVICFCVLVHLYVCLRVLVQCKQFACVAFVGLRICVFVYFCTWVVVLLMCLRVSVFLCLCISVCARLCVCTCVLVRCKQCGEAEVFARGYIPMSGAGSFNQHLAPCFTNSLCHFQSAGQRQDL